MQRFQGGDGPTVSTRIRSQGDIRRGMDPKHGRTLGEIVAVAVATPAVVIAPAIAPAADMAKAKAINTDGAVIGKASFERTTTGVLMCVVVGLPPGPRSCPLKHRPLCFANAPQSAEKPGTGTPIGDEAEDGDCGQP